MTQIEATKKQIIQIKPTYQPQCASEAEDALEAVATARALLLSKRPGTTTTVVAV